MNDTTNDNFKAETAIENNSNIKQTIITAYKNLDKVCYRLGLLNKDTSLASKFNSSSQDDKNNLPEMLKQLDGTRDQIEQQIVNLKKLMTNRCLSILSWEIIALFIVTSALLISSYFAGYWTTGTFSPPWLNEVLSRPILIFTSSILVIISFIILHYSLRNYFALKIANEISKSDSLFTLKYAFLLNSSFIHSIFRPEPIGLNWINRKRLQNVHEFFLSLHTSK